MSASTTYTSLLDTSSQLCINERHFLHRCAFPLSSTTNSNTNSTNNNNSLRIDGRSASEYRPIQLHFHRSHNISSCTCQFSNNNTTRVTSQVKCQLIPPPYSDRPNDGLITFEVDLSPMSSMAFEYVMPVSTLSTTTANTTSSNTTDNLNTNTAEDTQKYISNRILRILERSILQGGAIDSEALCVQGGKWVWHLHVSVTVLEYGGNVLDASVLSSIAALRHYRKPQVDIHANTTTTSSSNTNNSTSNSNSTPIILHSDDMEPTPLPIHHTPLTTTFALYTDPTGSTSSISTFIDPSYKEELVMNGTTTLAFNKYGEMCCLDFSGGCELTCKQLIQCANLGQKKCVELCQLLENALSDADQKAIHERLHRLKTTIITTSTANNNNNNNINNNNIDGEVPLPPESTDTTNNTNNINTTTTTPMIMMDDQSMAIAAVEEESYRIAALDYASGHVAAKVKENDLHSSYSTTTTTTRKNIQSSLHHPKNQQQSGMVLGSLMETMLQSTKLLHSTTKNTTTPIVNNDIDDGIHHARNNTNNDNGDNDGDNLMNDPYSTYSSSTTRRTQEADDEFNQYANTLLQQMNHPSNNANNNNNNNDNDTGIKTNYETNNNNKVTMMKMNRMKLDSEEEDDDEEEETIMLQSEFTMIGGGTSNATSHIHTTNTQNDSDKHGNTQTNIMNQEIKRDDDHKEKEEDEDDIDDLAMAVVKKKKNTKKAKKK